MHMGNIKYVGAYAFCTHNTLFCFHFLEIDFKLKDKVKC